MKRVVGVSLGSSTRDSKSTATILSEEFEISRIGTDGDMRRFAELVRELDGKVDAIGLGGADRYLYTEKHRYTIRDADKLFREAKVTPVVDGSGVKNTLERKMVHYLQENGLVDFAQKRVMVVCAVDRFGMAQAIAEFAREVIYGDLMFNVGVPVAIRSYRTLCAVADLLLPLVVKLPFKWIYPTGSKQEQTVPRYQKHYAWAEVIAGDLHLIRRTMPTVESGALKGKIIITNTVTAEDRKMFVDRGVKMLVTATPEFSGRRFGTNVFEAVLITLLGKKPEEVTREDYDRILFELDWKPTISMLEETPDQGNEEKA